MMPVMDGIEACDELRKNPKLNNIAATLTAFLTQMNPLPTLFSQTASPNHHYDQSEQTASMTEYRLIDRQQGQHAPDSGELNLRQAGLI